MSTPRESVNWNNALLDEKPLDGQLVLVSVNGVYYVCRFDSTKQVFRLRDEPAHFFDSAQKLIYWLDINDLDDGAADGG